MLEQWFDLNKKISKQDLEEAVEQMQVYALKDGFNINDSNVKKEINDFKRKVREHNRNFCI